MELLVHLFPANLGDSACILEIVQAISAFRQFGDRSGMIRQPQCRNWLHFLPKCMQIVQNWSEKGVEHLLYYRFYTNRLLNVMLN